MTIPWLKEYNLPEQATLPESKVKWPIDADKAVLLIHDMQGYFTSFYGENSDLINAVINNITKIKRHCKALGIPIVYTAQPKEQSLLDRGLLNDMWGPGLNRKPDLQPIVPELTPESDDTILQKYRYSAFHRSNLEELMQNWQRDQLIVCGIYAHIGCMMTAADAFMRDIKPFFVADALGDFSQELHLQSLHYVASCLGKVISIADVLQLNAPNNTEKTSAITQAELLAIVLDHIDEDESEFDPEENLIDYGLDSVKIMEFVSQWRARGVDISFTDLAEQTTFNGWWALISEKQPAETLKEVTA